MPLDFSQRLGKTLERTLPKVGPEVRAQLAALVEPRALAVMAAILAAWVASHAVGLGEIIDVIVAAAGALAIGWAVFAGIDELYEFAKGAYLGHSDADFDAAANHLAKAIGILGIQAVLAVLFRGAKRPMTGKGGPTNVGTPPPIASGMRYTPTIVQDARLAAGEGMTTMFGDITVSSRGSTADRALVLLHEKVHQFFAPKLVFLRGYRASTRYNSYTRSSLYRYIEEALAETIAQVGVLGFRKFFVGVRFPVDNGYMYLMKGGGFDAAFRGAGLVPEAAALVYSGIVAGIPINIYFMPTMVPTRAH
ncbi:MAG TPA: hypothetical protein VJV79_40220 [Polyangiaceae bacterium]|nr:hypothetical protein [Polyangiaceae bacterium]